MKGNSFIFSQVHSVRKSTHRGVDLVCTYIALTCRRRWLMLCYSEPGDLMHLVVICIELTFPFPKLFLQRRTNGRHPIPHLYIYLFTGCQMEDADTHTHNVCVHFSWNKTQLYCCILQHLVQRPGRCTFGGRFFVAYD
jgi:hypothetical protein